MFRLRRYIRAKDNAVQKDKEGISTARRYAEKIVYGFLDWFSSFNSVWETTVFIFVIYVCELLAPHFDPGHLVFILFLSLYATFTQNAIAHVNQRVSTKVDSALGEIRAASLATLQMGKNEEHIQTALISQTSAILSMAEAMRGHLKEQEAELDAIREDLLAHRELAEKDRELAEKDRELAEKDRELAEKDYGNILEHIEDIREESRRVASELKAFKKSHGD